MCVGAPLKGDWRQPFPCFVGWHTTDVEAVQEAYNGVNVLRCDLDPGGKCRRAPMKHSVHYKILYDEKVKYVPIDKEDHKRYLKRKRTEMMNDREFKQLFHIEGDLKEDEEKEDERDSDEEEA